MELTKKNLKERKLGIGGSDCAAAIGLSGYRSPLDVYLDKINPEVEEKVMTDAQRFGHLLEPMVIKEYERRTAKACETPQNMFKNEKYPWMLANIDALTKDEIVEVKTTRFLGDQWGEEYTDQIPIEYLIQCAHYCIVLNKKNGADIAALGSCHEFRIYHYDRNKKLEEGIIEKTHDFWYNHVKKLLPPEPITHSDLSILYGSCDEENTIIATPELEEKLYAHKELLNEIKEREEEKKSTQIEMQKLMKDAAYICDTGGSRLISWKKNKAGRRIFRTLIN